MIVCTFLSIICIIPSLPIVYFLKCYVYFYKKMRQINFQIQVFLFVFILKIILEATMFAFKNNSW